VGSARAFGPPPGPFQEASSALALLKGDQRGPPSRHNLRVAYADNAERRGRRVCQGLARPGRRGRGGAVTETRYLVPAGADWAVWDDANAVLAFMTDAEAVENARENEALLGGEFGRELPPDPTPEEAWEYVNALWEGDPGGRGWQARVPAGATWLSLRDDEGDPARGGGPELTFGFGEPPVAGGTWEEPGY
jgi:hypothetical protein